MALVSHVDQSSRTGGASVGNVESFEIDAEKSVRKFGQS
jgi:hypothetical protein